MSRFILHAALLIFVAAPTLALASGPQSARANRPRPIDVELMEAVLARDVPRVKSLLASGADPNYVHQSAHWAHPVLYAALPRRGEDDDPTNARDIAKALVAAGASLSPTMPGFAVLMVTIVLVRDTEGLNLLLELGFDINARGSEGVTLLMLAASRADEDFVAELLKRGADPCAIDEVYRTAADHARCWEPGPDEYDLDAARRVGTLLDAACAQRQPN